MQTIRPHHRIAMLFALIALAAIPAASRAQSTRADYPILDGSVYATAISGNTLYLGGSFTIAGPPTGGGILLDAVRGNPVGAPLEILGGDVLAAIADGNGGYYLGGTFTSIRTQPRAGLAHLLADGTLDNWVAGTSTSGGVTALALSDSVLYVGDRDRVQALDRVTGVPTGWQLATNWYVRALAVHGNTVFLGGIFGLVNGVPRAALASADATTGQLTSWAPFLTGFNRNAYELQPARVYAMKFSQGTLYVVGDFIDVNNIFRSNAAALDPTTGQVLSWQPNADASPTHYWAPYVNSIDADASSVYVGGSFTRLGYPASSERIGWGALDPVSGLPNSLDLGLDNPVHEVQHVATAVAQGKLYVAGNFTQVLGQPRPQVGCIDLATGALTEWAAQAPVESGGLGWHYEGPNSPSPGSVFRNFGIVVPSSATVFVAGQVPTFGRVRRSLAAIDLRSGELLPWDPGADGPVYALAVAGGKVYAGGSFTQLGGVSHPRFGVIDAVSGAVSPLDPGFDGVVRALDVRGSTVYVGGDFTNVGASPRAHLAALSTLDGSLTAFDSGANGSVLTLTHSNSLLYAGGAFTTFDGQPRSRLAAVDLGTGALHAWNPGADGTINVLRYASPNVYAGGLFNVMGGAPKINAASVDATTGAITAWDPVTDGRVNALAIVSGRAYLGGDFTHVRGRARAGIASTDLGSAFVNNWAPMAVGGGVSALAVSGRTVIAAGAFAAIDSHVRFGLAGIADDAVLDAPGATGRVDGLMLAKVTPDPVRSTTTIRFALPAAGHVRLTLHDVMGRAQGEPLVDASLAAGSHVVPLDASRLPAGLYWCRLESNGQHREQRMVVVR